MITNKINNYQPQIISMEQLCGLSFIFVAFIGLAIASIATSIYFIKFIFEAGMASITSAYVICEMVNKTANITCPAPWKYDTHEEAMISMRHIADNLYIIFIVLIILSFCLQIFSSHNKKDGYTSV